ncbi:MAG TPA: hypothetical protein VJO14_08410 [Bacteroidota bacterium]|nr:hypothetical protein [Bacteroidota bacterium]
MRIQLGEFRWLTVASPEDPDGVELVLEPMGFPPARTYQKALYEAGIPFTALFTDDIQRDFKKLNRPTRRPWVSREVRPSVG